MARNVLRILSVFDSGFPRTSFIRLRAEAFIEIPNALSSGSLFLLTYANPDKSRVNTERLARRGISFIPQDVELSTSPIRGTTATLNPCLLYTSPSPRDRQKS